MTTTNFPSDAIIARARKLMEVRVERGAGEAEAAFAAQTLQRMMAEHNLSMAHIDAQPGAATAGTVGGKRTKQDVKRKQVYRWQRRLMEAVAGVNFCRSLERFERRLRGADVFDGYDLVGRIDNVTTATLMFDYLLATIERLARDDVNNDPTQFFTRYAHSFKEGAADRLIVRLQRQRRELEDEQERAARAAAPAGNGNGTALILLSEVFSSESDFNNDHINGWEPGRTARQRRQNEADNARRAADRDERFAWAKAQGHNDEVADWYRWGYTIEQAINMARVQAAPDKPETAKQRRARERRSERSDRAWWRQQRREQDRLDHGAYRKGQDAGDSVSLNKQVKGD